MMAEHSKPEPQVMVFGRRRGRPRVTSGETSILAVRIWSDDHDALIRKAKAERKELSEYIRGILCHAAKP